MVQKDLIEEMIELQKHVDHDNRRCDFNAWLSLRLSIGQLKALLFIGNCRITSARKLAAAVHATPANVSSIVARLLDENLITRTRNPNNRRAIFLQTTCRGDELITKLIGNDSQRMNDLFNSLNDEEARIIAQYLKIMAEAIERGGI
jgi:DNA-binding MarR family transcriptional regulator